MEETKRKAKEGKSFAKTLRKKEETVPRLVTECIEYLLAHGLEQEGILRVSGSAVQIKVLKRAYEKGKKVELEMHGDPHTVAGLLKIYFRDSAEPLLTTKLYDDLIAVMRMFSV